MHQVQSAITTKLPSAITPEAMAVRGALLERGLETPMVANDLSEISDMSGFGMPSTRSWKRWV